MARPRKQGRSYGASDTPRQLREVTAGEPVASIGPLQELRRARQAQGIDLATAAKALRIRAAILRALEEGRIAELPGPTYTVAFLRSYATYLGLDGADLVQRFRAQASDFAGRQELYFPEPARDGLGPTTGILAGALVLAVLIYAGWYLWSDSGRAAVEMVPPVPSRLVEAPAPPAVVPPPVAPPPVVPVVAVQPAAPAVTPAQTAVPAPAAVAPTTAAQAPGVPQPAAEDPGSVAQAAIRRVEAAGARADGYVPQVFGRQNRDARVVLRARMDSWIQVLVPGSAGNEPLLTRVLKGGDVFLLPNRPGLLLNTGNAGGLEIEVDGRPVPPIGTAGEVRRNITLDAGALRAGSTR